jgi:magnesium transporter
VSAIDALARALIDHSPASAARTLERFDAAAVAELLGELPAEAAAELVRALSMTGARAALEASPAEVVADILARLPAPRAAALVRGAAPDRRKALLEQLPAASRAPLARALAHPPNTAGALMEPADAMAGDADAAAALALVRELGARAGAGVPVVDGEGRLLGVVPVAVLVATPADARLVDLARREPAPLHEEDDAAAVVGHPGWRVTDALPVVTGAGLLAGVVRFRTVKELLAEAAPAGPGQQTLPIALAELFWLGLAGITDGLGRVVTADTPGARG